MPKKEMPTQIESGDDLRLIERITLTAAERLRQAGIVTYAALAARSPEELAELLEGVRGMTSSRIADQDWIGQARSRAGRRSEPADSSQRYASFNVEVLLEPDDHVRSTKVHDHQTNEDHRWSGWDEGELLALFRRALPATATQQPATEGGLELPPSSGELPPAPPTPAVRLPASFLLFERLTPVSEGKPDYLRRADEATTVHLAVRVNPEVRTDIGVVDYTAEVAARRLDGEGRVAFSPTDGEIGVEEPVSAELTGGMLEPGLYQLAADVVLYPAGHIADEAPIYRRHVLGDLLQVVAAATSTKAQADLAGSM